MDKSQRESLLARYMVGRYRLGYEQFALYLAGILFEMIISKKLIEIEGLPETEVDQLLLGQRIQKLTDKSLRKDSLFLAENRQVFTHYHHMKRPHVLASSDNLRLSQIGERLHNFQWLRNQVMHGKFDKVGDEGDSKKVDMIQYVWSELAPDSFKLACDDWERKGRKGKLIDILYEHTADYMIRAIDEIDVRPKDRAVGFNLSSTRINMRDFDNLFELRRKMVPLKNYLDEWLKKKASFLHTDILTTIDTTSAYIWMPLVSRKTKESKQIGIYNCSVSLLATPLDFRIYMDFGGYAIRERRLYCDFLTDSPEYSEVIESFKDKPCLEVFDIDWYSFIFNRRQFPEWLGNKDRKDKALENARRRLDELPTPLNDPITWNRNLHGYIFSKYGMGEDRFIDFQMLEPELLNIIELFQSFRHYVQRIDRKKG
jgi:hypothetical protein